MSNHPYTNRQNRPNKLLCTGGALLACTLVLGSVAWLFSDAAAAAATVLAQQHAARHT
jgi:hypothetical protein